MARKKKQIAKSWIKREVFDLSNNQKLDDTAYTRYTFPKNDVYISFCPGWNDNKLSWDLSGNQLTIGISIYTIESLTDSTLTIFIPGFRRIVLDDENYLNQKAVAQVVGQLEGEPVYEANQFITPRYKKVGFRHTIE